MAKYIFVTGGVVSSLGKGITAASLGRLLKNRGYKVTIQKFDPYINIDPGTMSPYQHGEVFVTDDGTETDLDLGHYERFIDINLGKNSNVTTGKGAFYFDLVADGKTVLTSDARWKVKEAAAYLDDSVKSEVDSTVRRQTTVFPHTTSGTTR